MMDDYAQALAVATPEELAELERLLAPKPIPYCPWPPYPKQQIFVDLLDVPEVLFGGSAGSSKSVALLMAALRFVEEPNYHALILRRTFKQLIKADSIMELSKEWMLRTDARWNQTDKIWKFPSGATLEFGHMEDENAKFNYQGPAYQFVGFDELTHFTETMYTYLFSRMRKRVTSGDLPILMRSTANPGGIGHQWVKDRFIVPVAPSKDRRFVKATRKDNYGIDQEAYSEMLSKLDPITRKQLDEGDWDAWEGGRFQRDWFRHTFRETATAFYLKKSGEVEEKEIGKARCAFFTICDPAASEKTTSDYTAIGAFAVTPDKDLLVLEVLRSRLPIEEIVPAIRNIANRNNSSYVGFEAVAFQWAIIHLSRRVPDMPPVRALSPKVSRMAIQKGESGKLVRATPAIVMAEQGQIYLPQNAAWKEDYIAEHVLFTGDEKKDANDDQIDMTAYAAIQVDFAMVAQEKSPEKQRPCRTCNITFEGQKCPQCGRDPDAHGYPSERLRPTRDSSASRRKMFGLS